VAADYLPGGAVVDADEQAAASTRVEDDGRALLADDLAGPTDDARRS
jgi:hypothetical protein